MCDCGYIALNTNRAQVTKTS